MNSRCAAPCWGMFSEAGFRRRSTESLRCRIGAEAAGALLKSLKNNSSEVLTFGLNEGAITSCALSEALEQMDSLHERPKVQWFMDLYDMAHSLAKSRPVLMIGRKWRKATGLVRE